MIFVIIFEVNWFEKRSA